MSQGEAEKARQREKDSEVQSERNDTGRKKLAANPIYNCGGSYFDS